MEGKGVVVEKVEEVEEAMVAVEVAVAMVEEEAMVAVVEMGVEVEKGVVVEKVEVAAVAMGVEVVKEVVVGWEGVVVEEDSVHSPRSWFELRRNRDRIQAEGHLPQSSPQTHGTS